jgi:hypothetical protein
MGVWTARSAKYTNSSMTYCPCGLAAVPGTATNKHQHTAAVAAVHQASLSALLRAASTNHQLVLQGVSAGGAVVGPCQQAGAAGAAAA